MVTDWSPEIDIAEMVEQSARRILSQSVVVVVEGDGIDVEERRSAAGNPIAGADTRGTEDEPVRTSGQ